MHLRKREFCGNKRCGRKVEEWLPFDAVPPKDMKYVQPGTIDSIEKSPINEVDAFFEDMFA
jgi:hypothetical protein